MKRQGVFIGRFQPFTNAHKVVIEEILENCDNLLILVGSSHQARSLRNPFDFSEREWMIKNSFKKDQLKKITIQSLEDSWYNLNDWVCRVQKTVNDFVTLGDKVILFGHNKDNSSYYLRLFPQWELFNIKEFHNGLGATDVREKFFEGILKKNVATVAVEDCVQPEVYKFLDRRANCGDMLELQKEYFFIKDYKKKWEAAPYPPTFVTVDSLVLMKGHILLIKRGRNPGKGTYALPGGFVDQNETLKEAALRELKEETNLKITQQPLEMSLSKVKVFDNPWRDPRGRMITHVHFFDIPFLNGDLKEVKSGDDASEALWVPIGGLEDIKHKFFNDHYMMIKNMLSGE